MGIRHVVAHREEEVEGPDHVGVLGLDGGVATDHRIGSRGLLPVVDDHLGTGLHDDLLEEVGVLHRTDEAPDALAGQFVPRFEPFIEGANRSQ